MNMDQEVVRNALEEIARKNKGNLAPRDVWKASKPKDHPLHDYFEWDNDLCGDLWRDQQARVLIRMVRVEVTTTHHVVSAPAYVRNPSLAGDTQGYISLGRLQTDAELARDAVLSEFRRALAALERAKNLAVALNMEDDIGELIESLRLMEEQVEQMGEGVPG